MSGDTNDRRERTWFNTALPWLVLVVGLTLAFVGWWQLRLRVERNDQARFDRLSERVTSRFKRAFKRLLSQCRGANASFASQPKVPQEEWRNYYRTIGPYLSPGIVGLGYIARIPRTGLPALEEQMRQEGIPGYQVEPDARASGPM